jgi:hypothetical protein
MNAQPFLKDKKCRLARFEEWKEVLGSERLTGATLDRLTHRCTIVETGKESYRLRDARRRRRSGVASPAEPAVDAGAGEE